VITAKPYKAVLAAQQKIDERVATAGEQPRDLLPEGLLAGPYHCVADARASLNEYGRTHAGKALCYLLQYTSHDDDVRPNTEFKQMQHPFYVGP
jgi:hypothetical protein